MYSESCRDIFFKQNYVPIVRHNENYRRQHKYCDNFENYQVENKIKLWRQKTIGQTKFILVLIAELNCAIGFDTFLKYLSGLSTYRPNEQNHSTSALC